MVVLQTCARTLCLPCQGAKNDALVHSGVACGWLELWDRHHWWQMFNFPTVILESMSNSISAGFLRCATFDDQLNVSIWHSRRQWPGVCNSGRSDTLSNCVWPQSGARQWRASLFGRFAAQGSGTRHGATVTNVTVLKLSTSHIFCDQTRW